MLFFRILFSKSRYFDVLIPLFTSLIFCELIILHKKIVNDRMEVHQVRKLTAFFLCIVFFLNDPIFNVSDTLETAQLQFQKQIKEKCGIVRLCAYIMCQCSVNNGNKKNRIKQFKRLNEIKRNKT